MPAGTLSDMDAVFETLRNNWHFAVLRGPDAGTVIPLSASSVMGRGEHLCDPEISREHLRVRVRHDSVSVCDAGSVNGTRIRAPRRWWRVLTAHPSRCAAGTRVRLGTTVLELRRRPAQLEIPRPPEPEQKGWRRFLPLLLPLVLLPVLLLGMRRSPMLGLMMLPMFLMMLLRVDSFGAHLPGRRRLLPPPAHLLLAVAARSQSGLLEVPDRETPAAWLGKRQRPKEVLQLNPGDCVAVSGPQAANSLRWWCAQVLAAGSATLQLGPDTVQVIWGPDQAHRAKLLLAHPGQLPLGALQVVEAPRELPELSERWWRLLMQAAGIEPPAAQEDLEPMQEVPQLVALEELTGALSSTSIAARWQQQNRAGVLPELKAMLGVGAAGAQSVDLVQEGPHALLAGTTGSGKSELLSAWLLQLAISYSPERLSLVLVDYKGGATFSPLAALPHTAGVLTDLEPATTERALESLEAEVRRRESLLRECQAKDVFALPMERALPRLLVVVDEFATLANEHPEILESLIRVAAQGRSLGIHLILATQRPGGAISPAIRANTTIRVCLRVLDEADSRDVIGTTAAAHLPPHPGRLLLADSAQELQGPWIGDSADLQQLVERLRRALPDQAQGWRPWAEPLPVKLCRDELLRELPSAQDTPTLDPPRLLLARTDLPQRQQLGSWSWQAASPLLILGAPRAGRSTALQSLALAALEAGVEVHFLGATPADPRLQRGSPGVGTVANAQDGRRLSRILDLAASGALRGELLCLDDVDLILPSLDEVLGTGEGLGRLETLVRMAPSLGIYLALSAPLSAANARWAAPLAQRLVLGATQPGQASLVGLPPGVVTGHGAGRGVIVEPEGVTACQVLLPGKRESFRGRTTALAVAQLPTTISADALPSGAIGVGGDLAEPIFLDSDTRSVLVVGPPGSGRSTAVRALARSLRGRNPLVIDDLDQADATVVAEAELALSHEQMVIASATVEQATGAYRGALATLRERSALILLWPGVPGAQSLTGVPLRGLWDATQILLPGRAVLVQHSRGLPLQVANSLSTEDTCD